jgi:hypothetical protein
LLATVETVWVSNAGPRRWPGESLCSAAGRLLHLIFFHTGTWLLLLGRLSAGTVARGAG